METNRKTILQLLSNKSSLKQDISEDTQAVFLMLKNAITEEIQGIAPGIKDNRVRLNFVEKSDFEFQVMIGSDALFFQKHSNVFMLDDDHYLSKDETILGDPKKRYFGVINIYNFLADSVLYNRYNDSGFLIGRIFINCEREIFVEGKGQLGFLFKNPKGNPATSEILKHIAQCSFSYALEFDLMAPPYDLIEEISLGQILTISQDLQMKTSKRLGFKQTDSEN